MRVDNDVAIIGEGMLDRLWHHDRASEVNDDAIDLVFLEQLADEFRIAHVAPQTWNGNGGSKRPPRLNSSC